MAASVVLGLRSRVGRAERRRDHAARRLVRRAREDRREAGQFLIDDTEASVWATQKGATGLQNVFGVTGTEFTSTCAAPPASQGADGWVSALPKGFGDVLTQLFTGANVPFTLTAKPAA
jgi:hypothetical protein